MFRISKIMFPTEFGPLAAKALDTVLDLTKRTGAELILFHAVPKQGGLLRFFSRDDHHEEDVAEAHEKLDEYARQIDPEGELNIAMLVGEGSPEHAIVEAGESTGADLIIFGTKGGAGLMDSLLGSAVNYVIRHCSCPVLTIRNKPQYIDFGKIIAPIDDRKSCAGKIFWATQFARLYTSRLFFYDMMTGDGGVNDKSIRHLHDAAGYALDMGIKEVKELRDSTDEPPEKAILHYAEHMGADLICIMTQEEGRKGFMGTVADRLTNHSQIPVLSIAANKSYEEEIW